MSKDRNGHIFLCRTYQHSPEMGTCGACEQNPGRHNMKCLNPRLETTKGSDLDILEWGHSKDRENNSGRVTFGKKVRKA